MYSGPTLSALCRISHRVHVIGQDGSRAAGYPRWVDCIVSRASCEERTELCAQQGGMAYLASRLSTFCPGLTQGYHRTSSPSTGHSQLPTMSYSFASVPSSVLLFPAASALREVTDVKAYSIKGVPRRRSAFSSCKIRVMAIGYGSVGGKRSGVGASDMSRGKRADGSLSLHGVSMNQRFSLPVLQHARGNVQVRCQQCPAS